VTANLTITALDVSQNTVAADILVTLTDSAGTPVIGHYNGAIVEQVRGAQASNGTYTIALIPNADITPANTYYTVTIGDYSVRIQKSSATQTLAQAEVDEDDLPPVAVTGASRFASEIVSHGNSRGRLGATSSLWRWPHRFGNQIHCPVRNEHVSASILLKTGIVQGGWVACVQNSAPVSRSYGAQVYPSMPGVVTMQDDINDIEEYATAGDLTQLRTAAKINKRALISFFQLSCFFLHNASSTGQTYPTGSFTTTTDTSRNIGASFTSSGTNGAQVRVATSANAAGKVHSLFFLTNRTGGSLTASEITFTLDGTTTYPVGYSSSSPFTTANINPSSVGNQGLAVARFAIPDDAATHTILATAGSGGLAYNGYGIESVGRPVLWANTARRSNAYVGNATDAKIANFNDDLDDIVEEFTDEDRPVMVVDVDGTLAANTKYFSDGLHFNDEGHALCAEEFRTALDGCAVTATQRRYM